MTFSREYRLKSTGLIIERKIFQLKFGMSKAALSPWSDYLKVQAEDPAAHVRVPTDISGNGCCRVVQQPFATFGS